MGDGRGGEPRPGGGGGADSDSEDGEGWAKFLSFVGPPDAEDAGGGDGERGGRGERGAEGGEEGTEIVARGSRAVVAGEQRISFATWDSVPSTRGAGPGAPGGSVLSKDLEKTSHTLSVGGESDLSQGRRAENKFAYCGLPPDAHVKWRNVEQERMVMRRHAARFRSLSDEVLLMRQLELGEKARLELEEARKEAKRRAQEAETALKQERTSATARQVEACRQAEINAIRLERIRVKEKREREWNELHRDYPIPDYLKRYVNVTGFNREVGKDATANRFVNIAITGGTGTGKSSLIAKIMRNFGVSPGKMPHISFEADGTTEPTPYVFPGFNKRVRLWDLPGQGTERFPSVSYLRDMGLKYFDALLLTTDGRWKTDDSMLTDAIRFAGIWFRVVRTKVDLAVDSGLYDHGISQEEALEQARTTLQKQLITVTNPNMIHLVTTRSHFWTSDYGGAPFGLVSTLCDELKGFIKDCG